MPAFPSASRRLATRGALLLALATLVLAVPAAAQAATRYAAPGATGAAPCAAADPCPIGTAVDAALDGDEISLRGGTYAPTSALEFDAAATMHGPAPGAGSAVLDFSSLGTGFSAVNLNRPGVTLRDLTLERAGGQTLVYAGSSSGGERIERVRVLLRGDSEAVAMTVRSGALVRDTVVWQEGDYAALMVEAASGGTAPVDLVNVTAVGWEGLRVNSFGMTAGVELPVHAGNCIFRDREDGGHRGVQISTPDGKPVTLEIDHSNVSSVGTNYISDYVEGAGMQTEPPHFAAGAAADFRQLPGSPTVDAGTSAPPAGLGSADVDGEPRLAGATADIGADELQPPAAGTTGSPTGPSSATAPRRARLSIKSAGLMPRRFAAPQGRRGGAVSRLRIRLSAPATVRFAIERLFPPRHGHGRDCVGPRPHGHPCTRFRRIATLPARALPAGRTTLPFDGRVHGRSLRTGRYRLRLVAHGRDGQRSRFRYIAFWVLHAS
jgi:hypothetical protein